MNKRFLILLKLLLLSSFLDAAEVVFPARQIEKGKLNVAIFHTSLSRDVLLSVSDTNLITVGGISYFSKASNDFKCGTSAKNVNLKVVYNPAGGSAYFFQIGRGDFEIEIPSDSVKNRLSGLNNGVILGAGIRSLLLPDTIVTPALSIEVSVTHQSYVLDIFKSSSDPESLANNKIELTDIQSAFVLSKRYKVFEPYGGIKVFRVVTKLQDRDNISSAAGIKDNASLFAGSRLEFDDNEYLYFEGSFVGETQISLGLGVNF